MGPNIISSIISIMEVRSQDIRGFIASFNYMSRLHLVAMFFMPGSFQTDVKLQKLTYLHTPPETGRIVKYVWCFG